MKRLRADDGMTLIELAIGALLTAIILPSIGSFLISTMRAGAFTEGQSATFNNARNVMQQIEKETRGAELLNWCAPIGYCLEVYGPGPTNEYRTVRYLMSGTDFAKQQFSLDSNTWGGEVTLIERVTNDASTPIFSCDTQSTLLRVNIDLRIEPTPQSDPNLRVTTSIRPRNFPSAATCPVGA